MIYQVLTIVIMQKIIKNLKIKDNDLEINKIIQKIKKEKPIYPLVVDDFFPICLKMPISF